MKFDDKFYFYTLFHFYLYSQKSPKSIWISDIALTTNETRFIIGLIRTWQYTTVTCGVENIYIHTYAYKRMHAHIYKYIENANNSYKIQKHDIVYSIVGSTGSQGAQRRIFFRNADGGNKDSARKLQVTKTKTATRGRAFWKWRHVSGRAIVALSISKCAVLIFS